MSTTLARAAARGAAWNFLTVLAERGFGFLVLGVMLRHIPLASVGVVALGSALSELVRMLVAGGAGEQVQAAPDNTDIAAGAFWSQLLVSLAFIAALLAAAPWVGRLYHAAMLAPVLVILALNVFVGAFAVVPAARLGAQFRFRALGFMALGSTVAGGMAALPLAIAGHGIAALLWQRSVGVVAYTVAAMAVARWRPPAFPAWGVLAASFRFSWPLMQAALVDYVSLTAYVMAVGLRVSAAELGLFRIAQRLAEALQEIAYMPARKVFLPVFVEVGAAPMLRFEAVEAMIDVLALVICFVSAVCGAAARPLVVLMFGRHWAGAAPVFSVLTLVVPLAAMYGIINPLLTAAGRTGLVGWFALANAALVLAACWFAAPFGLPALAWALAGRGIVSLALLVPALRIALGREATKLLRLLVLPLVAMLAARLASSWIVAALPEAGMVPQLVLAVGSAAAVFGLVSLAVSPLRVVRMARRLHRALLAGLGEERRFI
jgi:O-antigen/teichoic acid export membrane protein